MSSVIYDKNRRPIKPGDIIKVFHFIAAVRRKRYYMYKQALEYGEYSRGGAFLKMSHLSLNTSEFYQDGAENQIRMDYEIVQSCGDDYEDREKISG